MRIKVLAIIALLLALAAPVRAQLKTGTLSGTVSDSSGVPLPGATVILNGRGILRDSITDAQGNFQFLGLWPDVYTMRVSLDGFVTMGRNPVVQGGSNTEIAIELEQTDGWVCDLPSVPLPTLAPYQTSRSWTVSTEELRHLPMPHDPWSVLRSMPGVLTDR